MVTGNYTMTYTRVKGSIEKAAQSKEQVYMRGTLLQQLSEHTWMEMTVVVLTKGWS